MRVCRNGRGGTPCLLAVCTRLVRMLWVFKTAVGSGAKAYFAEDHEVPDRLFRKVICRRYTLMAQESKEIFLIVSRHKSSQCLSGFE